MFNKILLLSISIVVLLFLYLSIEPNHIVKSSLVLSYVNNQRIDNKRLPVKETDNLDKGAQERAIYLYEHHQLNHDGYEKAVRKSLIHPDASFGEDLAQWWNNDQAVVDAWMNSPKHKEIIFNKEYKYAGVGKYKGIWVLWMSSIY